jgi:Xaa-Pro aminopeptidase
LDYLEGVMKKIPSLFRRDYEGNRQVFNATVEGCEWVAAGAGIATEKFDGTACAVIASKLYARHDRKRNKTAPEGWIPCEEAADEHTGHWPGWRPVGDGPEDKWHREAYARPGGLSPDGTVADGTYELVGPKVQGNPHNLECHCLYRHGGVRVPDVPRRFDALREWLIGHPFCEGIVWHHPDGRMCKIKRRDFGLQWPPKREKP